MKLFKYEGYKITVEPEALLLKPFKALWKRDRSLTKDKAMMELGFIYFFCDVRSDYQYIVDPEDRMKEIKLGEGLPEDWEPDKLVKEAIDFYNSFKSSSILLLEDTRKAVNKFRKIPLGYFLMTASSFEVSFLLLTPDEELPDVVERT